MANQPPQGRGRDGAADVHPVAGVFCPQGAGPARTAGCLANLRLVATVNRHVSQRTGRSSTSWTTCVSWAAGGSSSSDRHPLPATAVAVSQWTHVSGVGGGVSQPQAQDVVRPRADCADLAELASPAVVDKVLDAVRARVSTRFLESSSVSAVSAATCPRSRSSTRTQLAKQLATEYAKAFTEFRAARPRLSNHRPGS
jgi:hypothetical protein